jgi:hypothetical protein
MFKFRGRRQANSNVEVVLDVNGHIDGFKIGDMRIASPLLIKPTIEEVRDQWAALYADQSDQLEQTVRKLDEANGAIEHLIGVEEAARQLMEVMNLMVDRGTPVFSLNDAATAVDRDAMVHAVTFLRARLQGTEVPAFIKAAMVTH